MIIDAHLHILTGTPGKEYLPRRYRWLTSLQWAYWRGPRNRDPEKFMEQMETRISDPAGDITIKNLDEAGVDAAVPIAIDFGLGMGEDAPLPVEEMFRQLGAIQCQHPGRLYSFVAPDARRKNALKIFETAVKEYGAKGFKVLPQVGYYASDRILYPFYEKCLEYNLPVAICTEMETAQHRLRFNEPIYIADVTADFPDLTVIIVHAGYPLQHWFEESIRLASTAINAYLQFDHWIIGLNPRSAMPCVMNDERRIVSMIAQARDMVGAHRIIWGSDANFGPNTQGDKALDGFGYAKLVRWWQDLPQTAKKYNYSFTPEEMSLILGGNAARILGIEKKPEFEVKHKAGFRIRHPSPQPGH